MGNISSEQIFEILASKYRILGRDKRRYKSKKEKKKCLFFDTFFAEINEWVGSDELRPLEARRHLRLDRAMLLITTHSYKHPGDLP